MSEGNYNYKYRQLEDLAARLDPTGDEHQSIRKRVADCLNELAKICHDIEWIDDGYYGEEDFEQIKSWLDRHNF